jgi:hypothetical protein
MSKKKKTNKTLVHLTSLSALTMTYGAKIISVQEMIKKVLDKLLALCFIAAGIVQLEFQFLYSYHQTREKR